jgi:hypothetical protein
MTGRRIANPPQDAILPAQEQANFRHKLGAAVRAAAELRRI